MNSVKLVEYLCTNCLVVNLAPAKYAGRKGKCKNCKEVIDIPADSSIYIPPKKRPAADLDKKKNPGKKLRRFKYVGHTQGYSESKGIIEATSIENAAFELKKMGIKLITIDGNSYNKIIETKRIQSIRRDRQNLVKRRIEKTLFKRSKEQTSLNKSLRPFILPGILIYMFSPYLVAMLLWILMGMPEGLNEANSGIAAIPWLLFYTLPTGAMMFIVYILHLFVSVILYFVQDQTGSEDI